VQFNAEARTAGAAGALAGQISVTRHCGHPKGIRSGRKVRMAMAKRGSGDAMLDRVTGLGPLIINARNDKNLQQLLDVKQLNSDLEASAGIAAQLADTGVLKKPKTLDCSGALSKNPDFKQEPA
jgi:hypothetical protein